MGLLVPIGSYESAEEELSGFASLLPLFIDCHGNIKFTAFRFGLAESAQLGRQSIEALCLGIHSLAWASLLHTQTNSRSALEGSCTSAEAVLLRVFPQSFCWHTLQQ